MVENGISSNSYTARAKLIPDRLNPNVETLQNDISSYLQQYSCGS